MNPEFEERDDACFVGWEDVLNDGSAAAAAAAAVVCWDPNAFDALPASWKVGQATKQQKEKTIRRLQDLSFGLEENQSSCAAADGALTQQESFENKEWPFEQSSPCRMFGASSRKHTEKHSSLFLSDFENNFQTFYGGFEELNSSITRMKYVSRPDEKKRRSIEHHRPQHQEPQHQLQQSQQPTCNTSSNRRDYKRRRSCGDLQDQTAAQPRSCLKRNQSVDPMETKSEHHPRTTASLSLLGLQSPKPQRFKRAMSMDNVIRPEQYAVATTAAAAEATTNVYGTTISEHQPRRPRRRRRPPPRQVSEKEPTSEHNDDDDDDEASYCCSSSTESDSIASIHHDEDDGIRGSGRNLRDILKLGEQPKLEDLRDRANRRLVHSIMYRHKMGIHFATLRNEIKLQLAVDPVQAMKRPTRPMYVELIN